MPQEPITVTLPDGKTKEGVSWVTTPLNIAEGIAKSLAEKVVVAKVQSSMHVLCIGVAGSAIVPVERVKCAQTCA